MIQGENKSVRATARGTNSMFEFGQRRAHLGSNNNGWSNAANHRECLLRGFHFSTHYKISGDRRCASRVTDLTVNIHGTVSGVIADEFAYLHQLRLGGSSQVQDGNISIIDFAERFRFGKFSAQIKHEANSGAQGFVGRTAPQFAANPDLWCDLVPRSTLPPVIQQRQILTEQTRRQHKPRAPRQLSFGLVKNDRTRSEVRDRHDAESDRWPKKQGAPWPKDRAHNQYNSRSRCVIRADSAIHDDWRRVRRLAKKVEAISCQDKTTDNVDDVMLIRQNWRQRD